MIASNILTNKCFFRIKEAEEYEEELRNRLKSAAKKDAEDTGEGENGIAKK